MHPLGGMARRPPNFARKMRHWKQRPIGPVANTAATISVWLATATLATWSVMGNGIPALRHDWRAPAYHHALGGWISSFFQPWANSGIGTPHPYPTFYLLGFSLWPFQWFLNIWQILVLLIGATTFLAAVGGTAVAKRAGAPRAPALAIGAICTLNPWVYSKLVAGHILMVLAFALLLLLIAELQRYRPRRPILILLYAFSITQIEFFIILFIPLLFWSIKSRRLSGLYAMLVAALPIIVGIVGRYDSIRSTPYLLPWQLSNSVPPLQGLLMQGYSFNYAHAFAPLWPVLILITLLSVVGMMFLNNMVARGAAFVGLLGWVFASGLDGPIAPFYRTLVLAIPESGLFRELYDLIALLVVAYAICLSAIAAKSKLASGLIIACAICLAFPWITVPVSREFVDASTIPQITLPRDPQARTALFPSFQPLTYLGRGEGVDPDAYSQPGRSAPINQYMNSFPVDAAFGSALHGNFGMLRGLSVRYIIVRPYLKSDVASLRYQLSAPIPRATIRARTMTPYPIVAIVPPPKTAALPLDPREDARFIGDVDRINLADVMPDRSSINPNDAWVDARLAFASFPQIETPFDGAFSMGDKHLQVPPGKNILAWTSGSISGSTKANIAYMTKHLRWWPLPPKTSWVQCHGVCAVIAAANIPSDLPRMTAHVRGISARVTQRLPWLWEASIPANSTGSLRFTETYDPYWVATTGIGLWTHYRLDLSLNGWAIRPSTQRQRVFLIESLAASQYILELISYFIILLMTISAWAGSSRSIR